MIEHLRDLEDAHNDKELTALPQPLTCSRKPGAPSVAFRNLAESLLLKINRDLLIGISFRIVTQTNCLISNIVQTNTSIPDASMRLPGSRKTRPSTLEAASNLSSTPPSHALRSHEDTFRSNHNRLDSSVHSAVGLLFVHASRVQKA